MFTAFIKQRRFFAFAFIDRCQRFSLSLKLNVFFTDIRSLRLLFNRLFLFMWMIIGCFFDFFLRRYRRKWNIFFYRTLWIFWFLFNDFLDAWTLRTICYLLWCFKRLVLYWLHGAVRRKNNRFLTLMDADL